MTKNIFDKWNKEIDVEGLAKDISEAEAGGNGNGGYKEVPHGEYEVKIQQMELKESKKGQPMISIWFKIVSGDYKGSILFYNQVIVKEYSIRVCKWMLEKIVSEMENPPVVEFKTYEQFRDLLMDIFEAVADNYEYALSYSANKKKPEFSTFEIKEVFILE